MVTLTKKLCLKQSKPTKLIIGVSRKKIWKKGETSGLNQAIKKILIDDDQDCLIFRVELGGMAASCHVGYKSCFYRSLDGKNELIFTETEKVFDPEEVYEGQDNPTIL